MRGHYKSNVRDEDIFAEQSLKMPNGPVDALAPEITAVATAGIPPEIAELLAAVAAGKLSEAEAGHRLRALAKVLLNV